MSNAAWQSASEDMHKAQQQAGGQGGDFAQQARDASGFDPNNMGGNPNAGASYGNGSAGNQGGNPQDNVTDVDYEEVK